MEPVRISRLRLMARSPAHYAAAEVGQTVAMERGDAVHALVFGTSRVLSWQEGKQRRGKEWDAFVADNPDAVILTHSEGTKAVAIAAAVKHCSEAMRVLAGQCETRLSWRFGSRDCAGTPDVVGDKFVTELKTCATSHPERFSWQATKMGYHAQLAWYMDGVVASGTGQPEAAFVVAVESSAPYPVTVLRLTDRALDQGRRLYRSWLERLLVCESADAWPPYAQGVVALDVPDDEAFLEFGAGEVEAAKPDWAA